MNPTRVHLSPVHFSLGVKLSTAFVLLSLLSVALVGFFARGVTGAEFDRFRLERDQAALSATLTDYYTLRESWDGVGKFLDQRDQRPRAGPQATPNPFGLPKAPKGPKPEKPRPGAAQFAFSFVLTDARGTVLVGPKGYRPGMRLAAGALERASSIELAGQAVGHLLLLEPGAAQKGGGLDPRESEFLNRINRALLLGGLATTLLALLLGVLFSGWLLTPLRGLIVRLRRMQNGQLEQNLAVPSSDEVGELVVAFNAMSAEVARSQDLRRQMTADIAHDLKTPLTVILGHLEGLKDGVLKPSPRRFETLHGEARQLERLVSDLRTLSLADAGELPLHLERVLLEPLLRGTLSSFEELAHSRGVSLSLESEEILPTLELDPQRMSQVLGNLLENALRHTLPGERVTLGVRVVGGRVMSGRDMGGRDMGGRVMGTLEQAGKVQLFVRDTGEGIAPDKLHVIFERFYRADEARSSDADHSSSGLGLAISRSLVAAQGGTLWAESAGVGHGSVFWLEFPLEGRVSQWVKGGQAR